MPPPQPFLASKIQGFVCRSCLSRLQAPRNPRPLWLARSLASDNAPPQTKKPKKPKSKEISHDRHQIEKKPVIRIFDQSPDGLRTEVGQTPQGPADEALLESMQSTIQDVRKEMSEEGGTEEIDEEELQERVIGKHMGDMFQGEAFEDYMVSQLESQMDAIGVEMDKRLEKIDVENMSEEERSKIREEIFEMVKDSSFPEPASEPDQFMPPSPSPVEPGFLVPVSEFSELQGPIRALNQLLKSAAKNLDTGYSSKMVGDTYMAYWKCRSALLSQPDLVPSEAWQLLWNVFADTKNVKQKHMKVLGDDMTNAGLPLKDWQRLFLIQATFSEGGPHTALAIEQWEECRINLGDNPDSFKGYWELGVSMYCQSGQVYRALKAAEPLLRASTDPTDARIIISLIEAFLSSNEKAKAQKAWALYIRLRLGLGTHMEMKDYDAVSTIFFKAELPDLALGVFRDMMLTGKAFAEKHDSLAGYVDSPGVKDDKDLMKIGEKELTWDDPRDLSKLPVEFNNKFFFGKWLKKLIAENKFEASISVFNIMHERGIRADPRYLNGLIGAWLRTGHGQYHRLAEDTAWRMIQERLNYVENRKTAAVLAYPLRAALSDDKPNHKSIHKHPPATIETFAVLIQDYRRRQRHDRMKDLLTALKQAEVQANTFFMNQMIMVDSEAQHFWAWDWYVDFTRAQKVLPDFKTFMFLWFLAKQAVDPLIRGKNVIRATNSQTPVPRAMFAEMVKWAPTLNEKEHLPRELYDMIIKSFSLAQDLPGTAVAMVALQRRFNLYPNENTVRTIVLQLAREGLKNKADGKPRRLNLKRSPVAKERVTQVTKLLEGFQKQRVNALLEQGIVFKELEGDAKLEESLNLMSELLRHVTEIRLPEGRSVRELSEEANNAMGVPGCAVWRD